MVTKVGAGATASADAGATSIAVTLSGMTAGNQATAFFKWETTAVTISSLSDSFGSTWVLDSQGNNGGPVGAIAYCKNILGSGSNTLTANFTGGSATFRQAYIDEWSGLETSGGVDVTTTSASGSSSTYSAPAQTTTKAGLVYFGIAGFANLSSPAATGTPTFTLGNAVGQSFVCYLLSNSAQTVTAGATSSTSDQWKTFALALKGSSAATRIPFTGSFGRRRTRYAL